MKFQNIFLLTVAASLALAKHSKHAEKVELSDNEDNGIASEKELDTPAEDVAAGEEKIPTESAAESKKSESTVENIPSSDGLTAEELEKVSGEASDDYEEITAGGEASDDYEYSTDGVEEPTFGINHFDTDADEQSEDDDESSNTPAIAAGLVSAAALSSAGIFVWVKRSKKSEIENSPMNMA